MKTTKKTSQRTKRVVVREYDVKTDEKHRIVLRNKLKKYKNLHVKEYSDDTIEIEPRILVDPRFISKKTLAMIDESIKALKNGEEGEIIDVDKMVRLADDLQD